MIKLVYSIQGPSSFQFRSGENVSAQQQEDQLLSSLKRQINAFKVYKPVEGEYIRKIKLNIRIGNIIINDQFDWDVNNSNNVPEDFAEVI